MTLDTQFSIGTPTNEGISCEDDPDIVLNPIRTKINIKKRGERTKGHFEKRKKDSISRYTFTFLINLAFIIFSRLHKGLSCAYALSIIGTQQKNVNNEAHKII